MVALAVDSLCTVAKDCKVLADAVFLCDVDVGEETVLPCAAAAVEEVDAEGSALWSWMVREVARVCSLGTVSLHERPAERSLSGVVFIRTGQSSPTCS